MIIYVKRVSPNIGENALCRKMVNFDIKCDGSGTYKSVHAEIWFGDRFWGDKKTLCGKF